MADTFLQLTETPNSFNLAANKFVRVNNAADGIQFWNVTVPDLEDVDALGAYAPSTGDVLTYFSDNKWKPASPDIYSAGNGLNKVGLGFNVQAGPDGGLVANSSGVYISDIANVAGTYGNASTATSFVVNDKGQITSVTESAIVANQAETITNDFVGNVLGTTGQISVVGGTGNNSNATLNLVATGVTAATYGNATTVPQITVDGYGRIQNVDLITIVGGGGESSSNVNLAYKTIEVAGQTNLSADSAEDTLTFVEGTGITLTTNAGADSITVTANASNILTSGSLSDIGDVNTAGIADGQALLWNTANSAFEASSVAEILGASGVTAGTYGSTGNVLAFTVNAKGLVTNVTETPYVQGDITGVVAGTGLTGGGTTGEVTLDLTQTGVAPGTYGDVDNIAQFTVDSLGRISSSSNVNIQISKAQLTNFDSEVRTLVSATGDIAYDNSTGVISFTERTDAEVIGLFTGGTGIDYATGTISLEDSGVTANVYGASSSIPQITVDAKGRVTSITNIDVTDHTQSLSWNLANTTLTIGGGNSVDLSGLLDNVDTDTQTLSLAGNVITISGSGSTVDLTTALSSVTSDYGDSNVTTLLGTTSVADLTDIDTLSGIANGQALLWSTTNSRFEYGNVTVDATDAYKTISVSGQTDVVATGEDTLTLVAGTGMEITTDAGNTSVTITADPVYIGLNFGTFDAPSGGSLDMGAF